LFFLPFCFAYIQFILAFVFASFLNPGAWSDTGSAFCFNPAKTWYNGWYSSNHVEVDPSSSPYNGELVGINAVRDGTISSGQDVVLKIATSGNGVTDLFVMFNRQIGTNAGVPGDGNEVIVVSQAAHTYVSVWEAGISSGQTMTMSWPNSGMLHIKVCSIDLSSPGKAHVLVYADGQSTPSCADTGPDPTPAPVATPTKSPIRANQCQDSATNFPFENRRRTCKYVSKKTAIRCVVSGVAANCPVTCETGCECYDSVGSFNYKKKSRTCEWVGRKNTVKRCTKNRLRSNCPVTCGVC